MFSKVCAGLNMSFFNQENIFTKSEQYKVDRYYDNFCVEQVWKCRLTFYDLMVLHKNVDGNWVAKTKIQGQNAWKHLQRWITDKMFISKTLSPLFQKYYSQYMQFHVTIILISPYSKKLQMVIFYKKDLMCSN